MPAPKDPIKYQLWKDRLQKVALQRGFGKWMIGRHNSSKTEFQKGRIPPHKGKKRPGIGGRKKGGIAWNKNTHFIQIQGKNHWNWKGGITPINRIIRNSIDWKIWRGKVYLFDSWTCRVCGIRQSLQPHHLMKQSEYPELRFIPSNGVTLCEFCHHTYGNHQKQPVNKLLKNV